MTKKAMRTLFGRLLTLPTEIGKSEAELLAREWARQEAAAELQAAEDALLLDAERVNGKNAEQRAAQLRQLTEAERQTALLAERAHQEERARLATLHAEFSAIRAAARLIAAAA